MQLSFLFSVLYFAAGVVSQENRNLRIAYEMMWLWNNYQLDLTKPEADRTIGYRCVNWLAATSECDSGVYQACTGSITEAGKEGTCSLREFLAHICNQPAWRTQVVIPGRNTAAIQNNLTPDIESTVENLYSSNQRYTRRHYKPQNTIKYCKCNFRVSLLPLNSERYCGKKQSE
ncbi:hypothetical protein PFICI_06741 [Pestalotiopsis fici W106-1]|uniref:Uncharacterized protein n=1 Tax=Pestalotiopsis fici (strain W106-1 / CGMCC3.15140) TaxID=1229662 RepID=W3X6U9_PESFW|nr:uncharacterized protein PFICI_06741 [Pestalotiopsis fici W106-1]ETS81739.1 hypothetical protein PFICI_06741 [Pestalotiopsis fici W106-1]